MEVGAGPLIGAVRAIIASIGLLKKDEFGETCRLCKRLDELRRDLTEIVTTGYDIGESLEVNKFEDEAEVDEISRWLYRQSENIARAASTLRSLEKVLRYEGGGLDDLYRLVSGKGHTIRILHAAAEVSKDELRNRITRVVDGAPGSWEMKQVEEDDNTNLTFFRGKSEPDKDFEGIRQCIGELEDCIKRNCRAAHLLQ